MNPLKIIADLVMGPILDRLLSTGLDAYKAHLNKEISKEELSVRLKTEVLGAFKEVAKSDNEAVTKTFAAFMDALKTSKVVQAVWAYWVVSQVTFLIWLEFGVPLYTHISGHSYPGVGALDQWAYAGVLACLGVGPLVLKSTKKPPTL